MIENNPTNVSAVFEMLLEGRRSRDRLRQQRRFKGL